MPLHTCKRCGYETSRSDTLLAHLRRKHTCAPILCDIPIADLLENVRVRNVSTLDPVTNEWRCSICNKQFKTFSIKTYHMKKCTGEKLLNDTLVKQSEMNALQEQVKTLQQKLLQLDIQNKEGVKYNTSFTGNNNTANNTNNVTNVILDFGKENLTLLSSEFLKDCLYRCQPTEMLPTDGENGLSKLIKHIHSISENKTVRIRNVNKCLLDKRIDNKWITDYKNTILDQMVQNGYKVIDTFKDSHRDDIESDGRFDGIIEEIDEYLIDVRANKQAVTDPIKKDAYMMLINEKNKEVVIF
jgi:hypothetical protein